MKAKVSLNLARNLPFGLRRVQKINSFLARCRKIKIAAAHCFVEFSRLLFHSVAIPGRTAGEPLMGFARIHVEKEGDIRKSGSGSEPVDHLNDLSGNSSGDTLIDRGRIKKTIRDDDLACIEGRKERLADQLCTAGGEEQELGLDCHVMALEGMLQEMPNALADGRAARFANHHGRDSRARKGFDQQLYLCALAAPLGTLESDKETCLTRVGHARIMNVDEQDFRAKQENVLRRG
jgi:hypothetical protein